MKPLSRHSSIEDFAAVLSQGLGKVPARFVTDMLRGIRASRSLNLTDIARALDEEIGLHATQKRLSRNLAREDLSLVLSNRLLQMGVAEVRQDTLIVVMMHKITKKYANRMEYLAAEDGYRICDVLAHELGSNTYRPLLATLWSRRAPGYTSDFNEVSNALDRVFSATRGKGVVHTDFYCLPQRVLSPLVRNSRYRFVVPLPEAETSLIYRRKRRPVSELQAACATPFGKHIFKVIPDLSAGAPSWRLSRTETSLFMEVGAMPVRVDEAGPSLSLIVTHAKSQHADSTLPLLSSEPGLRSRKAIMDLVMGHFAATDVISEHLRNKEYYSPADFRVFTYGRLQLLMTLLNGLIYYDVTRSPEALWSQSRITLTPHEGELDRDYLLPPAVVGNATASSS